MASQKTELKRHIEYLYARRSGAEWCADLVDGSDKDKIKEFIRSLSASLQENRAKLAKIEQEEQRVKDEEKAAQATARKARELA